MGKRHLLQLFRLLMGKGLAPALLLPLFLGLGPRILWAQEVDRLIASVNGNVITRGDLELARAVNTVMFPNRDAARESSREEVDHLVDLELMRQELQNFAITREDETEVERRLQSLRDTHAGNGGLPLLLRNIGLQESELLDYLRLQSSILRFVELRFRAFAGVSPDEIKTYYESRLIPQLQKAKIEVPPIGQISSRIEEILREEKINAVMEQWIKEIRRVSRIEYFDRAEEFEFPQNESIKP